MRVPTLATYTTLLNGVLRNKSIFDLYNFQSTTGLKGPTYASYGMQAFNLVSLEASLNMNNTFMQNNLLAEIEINAMNTAVESIYSTATDFKSMISSFSNALNNLAPDYTGGSISFTDNNATYLGETITINGIQYTFDNSGTGNNVDISALTPGSATYAQDVITELYNKINVVNPNPDIVLNGNQLTFPRYTVDGTSSVLNASGVTTGTPHTMTQDQYLAMQQLQSFAFASLAILSDSLNVSANGNFFFGGGVANGAPINFPFTNLSDFQSFYDGINITYPTTAGANLSNRSASYSDTGALTLQLVNDNNGTITAANTGGFLKEAIVANTQTTGDLTFDASKNTVQAIEHGAFFTLKPGDSLVLGGTGIDPSNAKAYIIKDISSDGKTITFEDSTPVGLSETVTPANDVTFSTSFPVGSVLNMDGFGNNIANTVQVTGVSDDGSTLYVTVDPSRFPSTPQTVTSTDWQMYSSSYYQGGDLINERRVSENQMLTFDIKGSDPAFEKMFRAFALIAQGNLIDTRNPADNLTGLIDPHTAQERVSQALQLIQEALFNPNQLSSNVRNYDFYTVSAKISSNSVVLNNVTHNQEIADINLKNNITLLKNVDETEAVAKALIAKTNLEASYAVLQNAMNVSLLNFL